MTEPDEPSQEDPQWERAHQSWALVIDAEADALSKDAMRQAIRVLRIKRTEREGFRERLPGAVRRGARVDLEALFDALREVGIPCRLVRR